MGAIRRMDHTGDTLVATWDPADTSTHDQARDAFMRLASDPQVLLTRADDGTGNTGVLAGKEWDVETELYLAFRRPVGG